MKKLTYEFVKEQFEKDGYTLSTTEYINGKQKLRYICPKGHHHFICWYKWQQGQRCPYCAGVIKLTIEFIESEFAKEGYLLLTKEYINNNQKLFYICSSGHKHKIKWAHFRDGHRCPYCYYLKLSLERFGEHNPAWQGGISCEPYCDVWLDKDFKESILERDNHQCQNPDCWGTSERLTIHHINYVKKNCQPENLITLCNSCNARANKNRKWHKAFYRIAMEKKNKIKKFVVGL